MAAGAANDFAGKFGGKFQVVVDDVFEMNAGYVGVGEQRGQGGFAFVVFILRDAAVVHVVFETQTREHLRLRQAEGFTNRTQFGSETLRTRARVSHQESPPDGSAATLDQYAERFCLQPFPVGSNMRSLSIVAVVMNLSYRMAMLITR